MMAEAVVSEQVKRDSLNVTIESPSSEDAHPSRVRSYSSKTQSDRVRRLLEELEFYDSLYICPITKAFPDAVKSRLRGSHCVRKYELLDYHGITRYYAAEMTSRLNYCLCSNARTFVIYMYDTSGNIVFESNRHCSLTLCLCGVDCCFGGVETYANFRKDENYIGCVISETSCSSPSFLIQNEFCDEQFTILGPKHGIICPCKLCYIHSFPICLPHTETSMGKIMYGYDGLTEDLITNPKTVGVIFPPRCSPEVKACLLTAGFMLDITYFDKRGCTFHRTLRVLLQLLMFGGIAFLVFWFGVKPALF